MGFHKKLDPQPQPTGCHVIHLLADAVPQIQPQILSFAASKLQPKVVHFNDAQLSANLQRGKKEILSQKGEKSALKPTLNRQTRQKEGDCKHIE